MYRTKQAAMRNYSLAKKNIGTQILLMQGWKKYRIIYIEHSAPLKVQPYVLVVRGGNR